MKNFYKFLFVLLFFSIASYAFANKDKYPSAITAFSGGGSYCQGSTAANLSVTYSTATCGAGGATTSIVDTVIWYQNTVNSTTGGVEVQKTTSTAATTTFTYTPSTLSGITYYYYAVVIWKAGANCAPAGSISTASYTTQTLAVTMLSQMPYISSATDQYATASINLGCTDVTNPVLEMKVTVGGAGTCESEITQFSFNTAGSTNPGTDITQARVYYTQQTAGYNAFNFFGSVNSPNGAFTVNGAQRLSLGAGTYYFYLCYDVASTATSGDLVASTLSSFTINGTSENNMSPSATASVALGTGSCSPTPDLPSPTSNIQTVTAGSLVIPMDNSHQNLWKSNGTTFNGFNIKAYGLIRALLMQDIPVKWVIKSGKVKDSSDFSANATMVYPTTGTAGLQYFKAGEFIVDTTYIARSVYPGEQTATQVITTFATRWKVAVYKLSSNTSVDVRYTLNHRPKIALFNNGGYESVQLAMLDSAKVWTSPNVDTALSAGSFSGLAECYTFCSESHWDNTTVVPPAAAPVNYPQDTSVVRPVWQFIEEGGNFLAQCAGIDKYENQMQPTRHFQSTHGVVDQDVTFPNNYYSNPDMAFAQFQGAVAVRSGTVANFELASPADTSVWKPETYSVVHTGEVTGDTMIAAAVHLGNPDSVGGNVFYLAGHDYQTNTTTADKINSLTWINGARMYLNAAFVPANRPDPTPLQAGSNVTICQGSSTKLGGSPTGPASGSGSVYTWSPSTGLDNPNSENPTATPTVTTTYTVFLNSSGCAYTPASVVVTVVPTPATPTATASSPVCVGSTVSLSASTVTGATYSWTGPNSFTSTSQTASITNATAAAAGTYSVVATISGCPGVAGTATVAITPIPATPTATNNGPICAGSTLTLGTPTVASATYAWSGPGFTSTSQAPSILNATTAATGTYSVVVTVSGCGSVAGTTAATVNPIPTTPTATNNGPICSGSTLTLSTAALTGATYAWSGPNSFTSTSQAPSILNATTAATGTYSVVITVSGCGSVAGTTVATVNPIPATPVPTNNGPICAGSTLTLSTTVTGATYAWSGPGFTSTSQNPSITNATTAATGTYSLTVTESGCTSTAGTTIATVNPIPATPVPTNNGPICAGSTLTLSTTITGATYAWSGPGFTSTSQNPSITNATTAATGTYSLTVTESGCTSTAGTTIAAVNPTPATPAPTNNGPICAGSTLTLSTTLTGAIYAWSGPGFTSTSQNPSITNATIAATGTYSLTVTESGCTSAAGTTIATVNPIPATPAPTNNGPICAGSTLTLSTTITGATYAWSGPGFTSTSQNPSITNATTAATGTYSLTVTESGCTSAAGTTITTVNPIPATPAPTNNGPICAGSTLTLSTTVTGATYAWSGPGFTSTSQNPSITNATTAATGTYSLTVTESGCTSASGTTIATVNPIPATPAATNNGPICAGSTLTLTTAAVTGAFYAWSGPNSFTSTSQNPSITSATTAATGTYSVTITVSGCPSLAGTTVATVNPIPTAPTASSNSAVCVGATLNLNASNVTGGTYSWAGPNSFTSTSQTPSIAAVTSAAAGTYSVNVTVSGCISSNSTTSVTINPIPATPSASNNGPICAGTTLNLNSTTVTGATYNWSGPNSFASITQDTSILNATSAASGTYSVTANISGCTSPAGTTLVTVKPVPTTPTATNNGPICAGSTLTLGTATVTGATYAWSGPNSFTSTSQSPSITAATTAASGTYSITVTVGGCGSAGNTTVATVNPTPATPSATSNTPLCIGSTLNLSASAVTGATYSWSGPNGFTSTSQTPTLSNVVVADAGTYSVTATALGCTGLAGTALVVVNPPPAAPTVTSNSPVCTGATLSLHASNITGASYSWTGPAYTSTSQNPSITNVAIANAGTYSVTATVPGCATSPAGTVSVVVNQTPSAPSATSNSPVCSGSTLNLVSSTVSGSTYNWNGPNSFKSNSQDSSLTNSTVTESGTYTVTASANGCTSAGGTVSVVVDQTPSAPTAGSNSPICLGGSISLTASNTTGASYSWTGPNGFTSTVQNPSIATSVIADSGVYSVNTTVAGCAGPLGIVDVTINPPPAAPTATSNSTLCIGATLNLTASTITNATYSWTGPNSFTSSAQNPTIASVTAANGGTYSVTAKVAGCVTSTAGTVSVVVSPVPATPTATSNSPVCTGSSLDLNASNVTGATYNWSGPNGFASIAQDTSILNATVAIVGTYSVTATVAGCTGAAGTVPVTVNIPAVVNAGTNQTVCANNDVISLNGTSSTGAAQWSTSGSGTFTPNNTTLNATYTPSNADTTSGSVLLTLTSKNNGACTPVTGTIIITFTHAPTANAGPNQSVCGNNATVTLNGSYSVASGAVWSSSGTGTFSPNNTTMNATYTPSSADTAAGSVTITLTTTGNGQCSVVTDVMKITITHAPNISAGSNVSVCKNNANVVLAGSSSTGSGVWTTSGTGTFSPNNSTLHATYVSSSADTTAGTVTLTLTSGNNGTCIAVNQSITVTYTPIPRVIAGTNQTVCANNDIVSLSGTSTTGSGQWTTSGTGTFSPNNNTLNATYTPSNADTTAGSVTLTLTSTSNGGCSAVNDKLTINFTHAPTANAGANVSVCSNNANVTLSGSYTIASGAVWSTSGSGIFSPNNATMNAVYIPSSADTAAKGVTITLTTTGNGLCQSVSSLMNITYSPAPSVNAGTNANICLSSPDYTLNGYSSTTVGTWTSLGSGSFSPNANTLNAVYIPSSADTAAHSVKLILTSTNNGSCNSVSDTVLLTYTKTPTVNAGSNQTVCGNNDNIALTGNTSTGTGKWTSNGTGAFSPNSNTLNATYSPSSADTASGSVVLTLTATGGCSPVTSSITITITHAPFVSAGTDQSVCRNNANVTLSGIIGGATTTGIWSTSGSGTFSPNNTTLNSTYIPSTADTTNGNVTIVLTSTGNGTCNTVTDTMLITYTKIPAVSAGPPQTVCANNDSVLLAGTSTSGSGQWTTSGTGTFSPNNATSNAVYIPSNADTTAGTVTLTFTSTNNGGCSPVASNMVITINHAPTVNAGTDQTVCGNNANVTLAGSVSNASGGEWSTTGTGTFSPNNTTLNAVYIPSAGDTAAGIVKLSLMTTGNGLCKAVTDTMVVTITPTPKVSAGGNVSVCVSSPAYTLNGTSSTGSGQWSTTGDGTFSPNNTTLTATYNPGTADTTSGKVNVILTSTGNGNCLAVSDTILIKYNKRPFDNAGSPVTVCANNDSVSLSGSSSTGSGIWNSNGTGIFSPAANVLNAIYLPSNADTGVGSVTLQLTTTNNGACIAATNNMVVSITPAPYVNAGIDQSICGNASATLSGLINSIATGVQWSTLGTGTFSPNNTSLNTTYTPSSADTAAHTVVLVLTTTGNGQCKAATDTMVITINSGPVVNAGHDVGVCLSNPNYALNGSSSTGSGAWITTNGSGSFAPNASTLNATYVPSTADTSNGTVTLVLTSTNNGGCMSASDTVVLTYTNTPSAYAGNAQAVCANNAVVTLSGTSGTGSGIWTTNGSGTFSPNNTSLNTTYVPSNADTTAETVTLTLTTTGGCSPTSNSMIVTFSPAPFANAGADQFACRNNPDVTLNGYIGGGSSSGVWSTVGSGTFSPNATSLNATYIPSSADTAAGSVELVLATTNNGTCVATTDTMIVTFTNPPSVNAGANVNGCANNLVALNGTITSGSGTGIWSTANGTGSFSPSNKALNAYYIPSNNDTLVKNVVLVLTTTGNGNCLAASDSIVVTVSPGPIVNAGPNQTVCANNATVTLSGSVADATGGQWSTSGSGTFSPNNTTLNATYMPSATDIARDSIELVLSSTGNGLCSTVADSMKIVFSPAPKVNAGADIYVCAGSTTASLNGSVTGGTITGTWTTLGSGTFTPNNTTLNATYNLSTADTTAKTVKLVLTSTNNGNCISVSDTVVIRIAPAPIANAGNDTTICAASASVSLHGTITGGSGAGVWSTTGSGTFAPNDSLLNANYIPSSADTAAHSVKIILTTIKACMVSTDTMVVSFNSAPVANAGVDQTVCANNANVTLIGNISNAGGGKWITTGSGVFTPNDSTLNAVYVSSSADTAAKSVNLILSSTGNGLCNSVSDTMVVNYSPAPSVNAGANIFVCEGTTTAMLNGSVSGGASTGQWATLGSGTFSPNNTTLNATYNLSAADTSAKMVTLVLTSTNNGGCISVSDTVIVKVTPIPTVYAGADTTVCANTKSVPIHGTVTGGSGTGVWKTLGSGSFVPGDSTLSTNYVPSAGDTAAKTVTLVLSAVNSCTPVSDTIKITFTPAPKDNAGADQSICSGSVALLKGTVSLATGGKWSSNGTGTFTPNDSALNVTYTPSATDITAGKVTIVLATIGNGGCSAATDTMFVNIQSKPVANFTASTACLNSTVNFKDLSTVANGTVTTWNWNLDNTTSTVQNPTDTYTSTGNQSITLVVGTSAGCADTMVKNIYVNPLPTAMFKYTTYCPDSVKFTDMSTVTPGAISLWNWNFGDSTSSSLQNPLHIFPQTASYIVTLVATSDSGCSATHNDTIVLEPCNTTVASAPGVPTAFTPNGDGNNDVLYVRGGPFTLFDFRVFNEWGAQVFQANVQSEGWDGKYHASAQPEGTFVWTLTGTTIDGKQVKMTGNVTLLR